MDSSNQLGEGILWVGILGIALAPFIGLWYVLGGIKHLFIVHYGFIEGGMKQTPPLTEEQKEIFKRGLQTYVNEGKMLGHHIDTQKVKK